MGGYVRNVFHSLLVIRRRIERLAGLEEDR